MERAVEDRRTETSADMNVRDTKTPVNNVVKMPIIRVTANPLRGPLP